jgi:hypothetical protein
MSGQIFISYRREESRWSAGRLYDRLCGRFDRKQVFMDIDAIALGDDFVKAIEKTVGECDVLIAVIGAHWLTSKDEQDSRRLDNPEDFVRMEIGMALRRDIRVIPVLVDGALMPRSTDLPNDLKALVRRNALRISDTGFDDDCRRLVAAIEQFLEKNAAEQRGREEKERLEAERLEKERLEAERLEKQRLAAEQREKDRVEAEQRERERLDFERREKERLEAERLEKWLLDAESRAKQRAESEQLEKERLEEARLRVERQDQERLEHEPQAQPPSGDQRDGEHRKPQSQITLDKKAQFGIPVLLEPRWLSFTAKFSFVPFVLVLLSWCLPWLYLRTAGYTEDYSGFSLLSDAIHNGRHITTWLGNGGKFPGVSMSYSSAYFVLFKVQVEESSGSNSIVDRCYDFGKCLPFFWGRVVGSN